MSIKVQYNQSYILNLDEKIIPLILLDIGNCFIYNQKKFKIDICHSNKFKVFNFNVLENKILNILNENKILNILNENKILNTEIQNKLIQYLNINQSTDFCLKDFNHYLVMNYNIHPNFLNKFFNIKEETLYEINSNELVESNQSKEQKQKYLDSLNIYNQYQTHFKNILNKSKNALEFLDLLTKDVYDCYIYQKNNKYLIYLNSNYSFYRTQGSYIYIKQNDIISNLISNYFISNKKNFTLKSHSNIFRVSSLNHKFQLRKLTNI